MTAATLHQFEAGMTEAAYRAERERIRATYGDSKREAGAHADQALAKLFLRSGWTQERLAQEENKTQPWVVYRLRFGAFLDFITTVINPDFAPVQAVLTERRFRSYWEQTADIGNYPKPRFAAVQQALLVNHAHTNQPPQLGQIVATLADGRWHREDTIVAHAIAACSVEFKGKDKQGNDKTYSPVTVTADDVLAVLGGMVKSGTHKVSCEKKKGAKGCSYRLIRAGRKIDLDVFMAEVGPILDGLKAEGQKNMATASPRTVAHLAFQLQKLIDKWTRTRETPQDCGPSLKE